MNNTTDISASPRRRIALLAGGSSGESEVSLASGQSAGEALRQAGHEVIEINPAQTGFIDVLLISQPDVVFIALHGSDGEDGRMQGLLELLRLPYTGSGVLASALAMDKRRSKLFYREAGLNVPEFEMLHADGALEAATGFIHKYGLPTVIKPTHDGSSLGVSIVHEPDELASALSRGFAVSPELMVERYITGAEVTVPVIGNDELLALPVIEIVPQVADFYNYEAKYTDGGATHIIPARLDPAVLEQCQAAAKAAHLALGCAGMSRSDFIVDGQGVAWIIETNTIPGMTRLSLLPDSAAHAGIPASELYSRIVELGIEAHLVRQAAVAGPADSTESSEHEWNTIPLHGKRPD